jgi:hypothetical protein
MGLVTWLLVGCTAGRPVNPAAWLTRRPPPAPPPAKEVVLMEIALLECPVGDQFINDQRDGLWSQADEQIVTPEQKTILAENGFRVGQISGMIPDELQMLLTSKRNNVNPRQRQVSAGHPAKLLLGPATPQIQFTAKEDGEPEQVSVDKAQCMFVVVPGLMPDGKVKLRFTPQVEYGEKIPNYRPDDNLSGWVREVERPTKTFANLSWETTLAPNQYVVVGTRFDQRQSLGFASFVQTDASNPVQRLLVIRAGRLGGTPDNSEAEDVPDRQVPPGRPPVLAVQAQNNWTTIRASSR